MIKIFYTKILITAKRYIRERRMKKKDIIISFAVSIVATAVYDVIRKLVSIDKTQFCDIYFFGMILFACICGRTWFELHKFKAIMEK